MPVLVEIFLTGIDFQVELDGEGNGVIKLSSREPVVEPYLNFLIEIRWPDGRLLREYTAGRFAKLLPSG